MILNNMSARTALAAALGFALAPLVTATTIFDDAMVSTVDGPLDDIEVRDSVEGGTTTVNIEDGAQVGYQLNPDGTLLIDPETSEPVNANEDQSVLALGASAFNMTGGETADTVRIGGTAVATISGGTIGDDLEIQDQPLLTFTGDALVSDDAQLSGASLMVMTGGTIDDQAFVQGNSVLRVFDGNVNDDLFVEDNGVLIMSGGSFGDEVFVSGEGSATITGGYIDDDLNAEDNAVIDVQFVEVGDGLDTSGNGVVNISDAIFGGGVEAAGGSMVNIAGGEFGEAVLATGGSVHISGGTFGEGVSAGPNSLVELAGGTLSAFDGAEVSAALNGRVHVASGEGTAVGIEAASGGVVEVDDIVAEEMTVNSLAGSVAINGGQAESLEVFAELGGVVEITGGDYPEGDLEAQSGAVITVRGYDFTVLGQPVVGDIPFVAGDIQGFLSDGTAIDWTFRRQFSPLNQIATIRLVPEPAACGVVGLGLSLMGAWGARSRRRYAL